MTEREWLACEDPRKMIDDLSTAKIRLRTLRLFVCACTRQVWSLLLDERGRRAVEVGERFADRLASRAELEEASSAMVHTSKYTTWSPTRYAGRAAAQCVSPFTARSVAKSVTRTVTLAAESAAENAADATQADLVRDVFVFGSPFRPAAFDARIRLPQVQDLAQAAYELRPAEDGLLDPLRLCVLADALEEAGVDDARLLLHLRSPGPHVRGCWAVDILLGKG